MRRRLAVVFALACVPAMCAVARAEWAPPDLRTTKAAQADVLAAYASAEGTPDPRFAERRERWTYVNGPRRIPVQVTVRGDDFRATLTLGRAQYAGGRSAGVRWRADANAVTHATLADDQGDAADRLPQSVFPFALRDCTLAGESDRFGHAWVLADRPPRDKPHWFYVDKASGTIAHEVTREGGRTIVTSFDRFEPLGRAHRPRHWRVSDGDAANDLEVTVDTIEPQPLAEIDVAIPQVPRLFAPASRPPNGVMVLPTRFRARTIFVEVDVDGRRGDFVLDTGTASITLDRGLAERRGWTPVLEHATVPKLTVGALMLSDASTLTLPLARGWGSMVGILGYDFFRGHVVHIDYARERVEVLTEDAAAPVFSDPRSFVMNAYVDEGLPLISASLAGAVGERFALDTGSPHLYVLAPFAGRNAKLIASRWTPSQFRNGRVTERARYLEGSILVAARRVAEFTLGPLRILDVTVGVEERNDFTDSIDIPLDGIIGTDHMAAFEWWFDYENGRIAVRRNR